jgi:hypothetical protein
MAWLRAVRCKSWTALFISTQNYENMKEQKFKPGDRVRVIKYGHPIWISKAMWTDMAQAEAHFKEAEYELWSGSPPETPIQPKEKPDNILSEDGNIWTVDMRPEIVGREGIVKGSYADMIESGDPRYAGGSRDERNQSTYIVDGIPEKSAWYDEQQLELI